MWQKDEGGMLNKKYCESAKVMCLNMKGCPIL